MKSVELKVKACSLAAEAVIIRRLERRLAKSRTRAQHKLRENNKENEFKDHWGFRISSLHHHRVTVVRRSARRTHLVRAFLSGRPYLEVENKVLERNQLDADDSKVIIDMAYRYGQVFHGHNQEPLKPWQFRSRDEIEARLAIWLAGPNAKPLQTAG